MDGFGRSDDFLFIFFWPFCSWFLMLLVDCGLRAASKTRNILSFFSFSFFLRFILEPAYLSWGGVCCYYGSAIFKNVFKIIFYFKNY